MATEKKAPAKTEKEKAPKRAKRKAPPAAAGTEKRDVNRPTALQARKQAYGVVVSDKMQKTVVVRVDRQIRHRLYKKYVMKSRRFKAHDENNEAKLGDYVSIVESRPLSRDKRWAVQKIIRKAGLVPEVNL